MSDVHPPNPWYRFYQQVRSAPPVVPADHEYKALVLKGKLSTALAVYPNTKFDHIRIGHFGKRICVFVVRSNQSAVLYDKTKGFPSATLLATLVLIGS